MNTNQLFKRTLISSILMATSLQASAEGGMVQSLTDFDVNETIFARLEYRPSNRIFLTFGYGHSFVGDGPFLLEDPDFNLSGLESAVYTVTVRGDF